MRTFIDRVNIRSCRFCGTPDLLHIVVDGITYQLDPHVVFDGTTVRSGWCFYDRHWRLHLGQPHPAFRSHYPCVPTDTRGPQQMSPDPFGTAAAPGASGPPMKDLEGRLLLIDVTEIKRGITVGSDVADAAIVNLVDLGTGDEHPGAALWGKVLVNQFTAGVKYVGRVAKGVAKAGQSPPWVWQDGGDDDKATAVKYLTHAATQSVSTPAAPAAAAAAPAPPWAQ